MPGARASVRVCVRASSGEKKMNTEPRAPSDKAERNFVVLGVPDDINFGFTRREIKTL